MIMSINRSSLEPLYLQIYGSIVSSISQGILKEDATLPSTRRLAKDLGINYHTVLMAYQLLELEGFVKIQEKRIQIRTASSMDRDECLSRFETIQREIIYGAKVKGLKDEALLHVFQNILNKVGA